MNPPISETLSLWGNGAVTLPKAWRKQFPTKHFMAVATKQGLLIQPILIEEYKEKDGSYGLRFPMGIEAGELGKLIKKANTIIDTEEKTTKKRHSRRKRPAKKHG